MRVFFIGSWGRNRSAGQTTLYEPQSISRAICLFHSPIHSPWTQKKDTHSLHLQCFQQRPFLKFLEKNSNSCSNGHLTPFDILITAHVICPTAKLLVDCGSSGMTLKFSHGSTKEMKNTFVNTCTCIYELNWNALWIHNCKPPFICKYFIFVTFMRIIENIICHEYVHHKHFTYKISKEMGLSWK